ncbi:MAG TPA: glycosyltransferase family 87 protein [Planctomycetota bacterium]|nr:glycosyltransferase family 87 protein [Planctomycetota bacterium]
MQARLREIWASLSRGQRVLMGLALLVSILAVVQGMHRASKGRNALIKWGPVFEAVERGEPIYGVGEEGYPTPPITLMGMAPFHALGPQLGALAWAIAHVLLAWWILLRCFRMAAGRARDVPWGQQALVLLLCTRILHSEVQHANINLWVAACVTLGAWHWGQGRPLRSGLALGLGAGLKVTPALAAIFYLRQKSARALSGMAAGLGLALVTPIAWLGPTRTLAMTRSWADQMLLPYLQGRDLALRQTEHINQSLLGLLGRLFADSVAIPAGKTWPTVDVSITLWALDPGTFRMLHLTAAVAVIAFLWWACARPRSTDLRPLRALGWFGLVGLSMLLLSERSWKHHHVVLPLAGTFVATLAWGAPGLRLAAGYRRFARAALFVAIVLILGSGEGVLGKHGADWAEAWGAYTWATMVLTVAVGLGLQALDRTARDPQPELT